MLWSLRESEYESVAQTVLAVDSVGNKQTRPTNKISEKEWIEEAIAARDLRERDRDNLESSQEEIEIGK